MTKDEIIAMARQAAAVHGHTFKEIPSPETVEFITAFYELVAAKEREACAKVCETRLGPTATDFYGNVYAQAIRARGEA